MIIPCTIPGKEQFYEIEVCRTMLSSQKLFTTALAEVGHRCIVLTDTTVGPLYAHSIALLLRDTGREVIEVTIPAGERSKTRFVKEQIEDQLFSSRCGRNTALIAVGGGVVTDIGGFVAATYGRGIPLFLLPTTLLGMVDAAIGGKNGVNVSWGKNLIGTIYHPRKILVDPSVLTSLPDSEFRNGIVEMIKHGAVADEKYFENLVKNVSRIHEMDVLEEAIIGSCRIKAAIVGEDEREQGRRHLLNFGHTIGHAIELLSDYRLPHGEAVALGMLGECFMATQLKGLSQRMLDCLYDLLRAYKLSLTLPEKLDPQKVLEVLVFDKKTVSKRPRCILLSRIGSGELLEVDEPFIRNAITWINNVVRGY
jgi:3-dehydroquinate synthase